eukprot:scaffold255_cov264-Prasinococcus_capsulatus_cf.AAC.5
MRCPGPRDSEGSADADGAAPAARCAQELGGPLSFCLRVCVGVCVRVRGQVRILVRPHPQARSSASAGGPMMAVGYAACAPPRARGERP